MESKLPIAICIGKFNIIIKQKTPRETRENVSEGGSIDPDGSPDPRLIVHGIVVLDLKRNKNDTKREKWAWSQVWGGPKKSIFHCGPNKLGNRKSSQQITVKTECVQKCPRLSALVIGQSAKVIWSTAGLVTSAEICENRSRPKVSGRSDTQLA